jgi:predicted nuclease of predicted toxin-antitoxin system
MRSLLDENMSSPRLASRLQALGHDPILAGDVGLLSVTDARLLIWAIAPALPVLTRDSEDFEDLHDLVMSAGGHHPGMLVVRFNNDPRHNLADRGIGGAINKHESSGVLIPNRIHRIAAEKPLASAMVRKGRPPLLPKKP